MAAGPLLLSVCVVNVIQLMSCQPTYDVNQQQCDVNSCERTEQLEQTLSQLVRDVAELKIVNKQKEVKDRFFIIKVSTTLTLSITINQSRIFKVA